ncbi:MAG TPA: hypothetical protein VFD01_18310 [Candidatus Dormibacteraeota bacterium]|nr:hypothetical protein [Candidatus Dormibacteraeota bacterium]
MKPGGHTERGPVRIARQYVIYQSLPCCGRRAPLVRLEVERHQETTHLVACSRCGRRWALRACFGHGATAIHKPDAVPRDRCSKEAGEGRRKG